MSSLRLALKKSLEENPSAASSGGKSGVFDVFLECNELLKTTKSKKRRSSSMGEESAPKKRNTLAEDSSTASLQNDNSINDSDDICDADGTIDHIISNDCNIVTQVDSQGHISAVSEDSRPGSGQSVNIQEAESIEIVAEEDVESKPIQIVYDENVEAMEEEEDVNEKAIDPSVDEVDVADDTISDARNESVIDSNTTLHDDIIDAVVISSNDEVKDEVDDIGGNEEIVEVAKKPRGKRRSGLLRALGITEHSVEMNEDLVNPETGELLPRLSSRAAAAIAKSRLAGKNVASIPSSASSKDDEILTHKKSELKKEKTPRKSMDKGLKQTSVMTTELNDVVSPGATPVTEAPWACCDTCQKWRKLPKFVNLSSLPEQWYCWMNEWDSLHNNCEAPEETEETVNEAPNPSVDTHEANPMRSESQESISRIPKSSGKLKKLNKLNHNQESIGTLNLLSSSGKTLDSVDHNPSRLSIKRRGSTSSTTSFGGPNTRHNTSQGFESEKVNWVQCNRCTKWRKVPPSIPMDSLPDTWLCEYNSWNPTYSRCTAKQEPENDLTNSQIGNLISANLTRSASQTSVNSRGSSSAITRNNSTSNQSTGTGATPGPKKITIQWVCCERKTCQKWRKIPPNINLSDLPEKWYCEMNTWDPERGYCDAPEESDNENDVNDSSIVNRSQLILVNSKGPGQLSYRRIIFGTDGKIRPIYSEKSKTGHGLFSFTEKVVPINRNINSDDSESFDENMKRVSYWYSSVYDESGINYSSTSKGRNTVNGATMSSSNALSKSQMKLEELNQRYGDGPNDSILFHFADNCAVQGKNNPNDSLSGSMNDEQSSKDELTMKSPQYQLSPVVARIQDPQQVQLKHVWPKKFIKGSEQVDNATLFEKRELLMSIIRTCLLSQESLALSIVGLFELIKASHFLNDMFNYYRHFSTFESLKIALRSMEDQGEVYVTTDSMGLSTVHYSKFSMDGNNRNSMFLGKTGTLLPPKLRAKKSKCLLSDAMN